MRISAVAATLLALLSCTDNPVPAESTAASAVTDLAEECPSAESYGAHADDGIDDRAALQAALNAGCLRLGAGRYDAVTQPPPRGFAVLTMPVGSRIVGVGPQSRLVFSGNPAGRDWRGVQLNTGTRVTDVALSVADMTLQTNEQTHVLQVRGPVSDIAVERVSIDHPVVSGSKRGDCLQIVGYPPGDGAPDQRVTDVRVRHVDFLRCARSGIAVHSGLHRFVFSDNRFLGTSDQDLDFEGTGDIVDGEISDNEFRLPQYFESGLSVAVMSSEGLRIHHNLIEGRGVDLYGCSACEMHHNRVTLTVPYDGAVVSLRKLSHSVSFHDEEWERTTGGGDGAVFQVADRIGAPDSITLRDTRIVQRTAAPVVSVWGIVGFAASGLDVTYSGPVSRAAQGVLINGSADDTPVRSDDLHVTDSVFRGPLRWVVLASGSYAGVGGLEVSRVVSDGATGGLGCENVDQQGGMTGPLAYSTNSLPAPVACDAVPH